MHYLMFRCSVYDDPLKIIRITMFAISFTVVCLFVSLFLSCLFVVCVGLSADYLIIIC